jgi:hypothetical protein
MSDEIIKNIFRSAAADVQNRITNLGNDSKEKLSGLVTREKHYSEFTQFLRATLADIITRGRQQETVSREFYEKELSDLMLKVNKVILEIKEEALKQQGASYAYEIAAEQFQTLPATLDAELSKARDLQARAVAGELGKRRNPGSRPDKLKDVRNYVDPDEDK